MKLEKTLIDGPDSFTAVCDRIANLQVAREDLIASQHREVEEIHERYSPEIESIDSELKEAQSSAQKFAKKNRKNLFPNRFKSIVTGLAEVGFRLGKPFAQAKPGIKWQAVADALESKGRQDLLNIKRTVSVDKDRLLREPDTLLDEIGVSKKQRENFFVESRAIKDRSAEKPAA